MHKSEKNLYDYALFKSRQEDLEKGLWVEEIPFLMSDVFLDGKGGLEKKYFLQRLVQENDTETVEKKLSLTIFTNVIS